MDNRALGWGIGPRGNALRSGKQGEKRDYISEFMPVDLCEDIADVGHSFLGVCLVA
jgi:hypothetical protein